ncbi:MAG: GH5_40 / GH5 / GH5_26, partial [uncultured Gemmatimonadetes bacterium]
ARVRRSRHSTDPRRIAPRESLSRALAGAGRLYRRQEGRARGPAGPHLRERLGAGGREDDSRGPQRLRGGGQQDHQRGHLPAGALRGRVAPRAVVLVRGRAHGRGHLHDGRLRPHARVAGQHGAHRAGAVLLGGGLQAPRPGLRGAGGPGGEGRAGLGAARDPGAAGQRPRRSQPSAGKRDAPADGGREPLHPLLEGRGRALQGRRRRPVRAVQRAVPRGRRGRVQQLGHVAERRAAPVGRRVRQAPGLPGRGDAAALRRRAQHRRQQHGDRRRHAVGVLPERRKGPPHQGLQHRLRHAPVGVLVGHAPAGHVGQRLGVAGRHGPRDDHRVRRLRLQHAVREGGAGQGGPARPLVDGVDVGGAQPHRVQAPGGERRPHLQPLAADHGLVGYAHQARADHQGPARVVL